MPGVRCRPRAEACVGHRLVRLLFDQNLSHRLVALLADIFPNSAHVRQVGLAEASDDAVWAFAAEHSFVLISKDEDFHQMSFLLGPPPQVIWVRLGNCRTGDVEKCVRANFLTIESFVTERQGSFLIIGAV